MIYKASDIQAFQKANPQAGWQETERRFPGWQNATTTINGETYYGSNGAELNSLKAQSPQFAASNPQYTTPQYTAQTSQSDADYFADLLFQQYQSLLGGLPGPVDQNLVNKMMGEVERIFGPGMAAKRKLAEDAYNTQFGISKGLRDIAAERLGLGDSRFTEDVSRINKQIGEDVGTKKQIQGRNFAQAQKDMSLGYARAGRTFSGDRIVDEGRLGQENQDVLSEIDRTAGRNLEENNIKLQRQLADTNLARKELDYSQQSNEFGLGDARRQALQGIDDFKVSQLQNYLNQYQNAAYQLAPSLMDRQSYLQAEPQSTAAPQPTPYTQPTAPTNSFAAQPKPTLNPQASAAARFASGASTKNTAAVTSSNIFNGRSYKTPELAEAARKRSLGIA